MSSIENQLLAEIEALRRVVASRDRTLPLAVPAIARLLGWSELT